MIRSAFMPTLVAARSKGALKGLGAPERLVMGLFEKHAATPGSSMGEDESILVNPPTQDVAHHVRDYTRFVHLLKWGAATALIVALFVMLIIS
jgi:hypothetical protein